MKNDPQILPVISVAAVGNADMTTRCHGGNILLFSHEQFLNFHYYRLKEQEVLGINYYAYFPSSVSF
jgi:hypothetical protein